LRRQLDRKGLVKLPPLLPGARRVGYQNVVTPVDLLDRAVLEGPLATLPIQTIWVDALRPEFRQVLCSPA
jgi:hypothetical protein